jgi:hypothetical protein
MRRLLPVPCLLALPAVAHACAACGAGVDRNRAVFLFTTIFLSLLPLSLLGAGLLWLRQRYRARFRTQLGEHEGPTVAVGAGAGGLGAQGGAQVSRGPIAVAPVRGPRG